MFELISSDAAVPGRGSFAANISTQKHRNKLSSLFTFQSYKTLLTTSRMAEPAWKIAMRERKKQKEEEEKKKQAEEEAKLASVPAWKRAMLEKKKGKTGSATTTPASSTATAAAAPTTTTSHTPTTSEKKWNAATSVRSEPLNAVKPKETSTPTVPSWKLGTSKKVSATKNIFEELQEKANSPQIPKKTPLSPVRESLLEPDKSSSITRRMKEQFETTARTGGVDDHKDVISTQGNDMQDNTGTSPVAAKPFEFPSTPTSTHPSHSVKEEPQKVEKTEPSSPPPPTTTTTTVTQNIAKKFTPQRKSGFNAHFVEPPSDSTDKMPAWKRELLRRKKGTSTSQSTNDVKSPPPSSPPATSAQSSSTTQATSAAATASQNIASTPKHEDTRTSTTGAAASSVPPKTEVQPLEESDGAPESKKLPEVVNASDKKDESDSPKLVHKEGKTIRAPVLKSKSKWADIKEEDPEFKNLPLWKQELIKRRQNDAKKRTEPIPKEEDKKKEEKKAPVTLPSRLMPSEGSTNTSKQENVAKPSHNLTPLKKTSAASTPSSPPPLETSETSGGSNIMNLLQKFGGNPNAIKKRPPPGPAVKENGLEVTLIDEESSDDEAPPTPVMKTSRSGSILKSPEKPVKVIKQNIIQLACMFFFQRTTFATL